MKGVNRMKKTFILLFLTCLLLLSSCVNADISKQTVEQTTASPQQDSPEYISYNAETYPEFLKNRDSYSFKIVDFEQLEEYGFQFQQLNIRAWGEPNYYYDCTWGGCSGAVIEVDLSSFPFEGRYDRESRAKEIPEASVGESLRDVTNDMIAYFGEVPEYCELKIGGAIYEYYHGKLNKIVCFPSSNCRVTLNVGLCFFKVSESERLDELYENEAMGNLLQKSKFFEQHKELCSIWEAEQ